jgi:outer membrane receptor protein involved in Fe transport
VREKPELTHTGKLDASAPSVRPLPFRPVAQSPFRRFVSLAALIVIVLVAALPAQAGGLGRVQFQVVDPVTRVPLKGGQVQIEELSANGRRISLNGGLLSPSPTLAFDLRGWQYSFGGSSDTPTLVTIPDGTTITLKEQTPDGQPPVKDIFIKVTATRLQIRPTDTGGGTKRDKTELNTFINKTGGDSRALTAGQASVASDSAGQQHIRGEHAEITYVVDGVPLPDTLSGRQGSVVVPSNIESLEIITGGFAPEFGGQTAAILNVSTLAGSKTLKTDMTMQGGSYSTLNGDFNATGPLGKRATFVLGMTGTRTLNAIEPQQPDNQTANNAGSDQSYFAKLRLTPSQRDALTLTLSAAPGTRQVNNRTGLGASFAPLGQGFGFQGLRNADGSRPDVTNENAGAMGAGNILLPNQQDAGQDITQREISEFATLNWRRQLSSRDTGLLSFTVLHSGQEVNNHDPLVNVLNLPIDNSIEFSPTVRRNAHHVQIAGSVTSKAGKHTFKTGLLLDDQSGDETYQLIPGSQLALNTLAAAAPNLAPAGSVQLDGQGNPVLDVNGMPVYVPTSGVSPTTSVHRSGFYRAAYVQDTWLVSKRFTVNYGLRGDWYKQSQNLGQAPIDTIHISPRINFSYSPDKHTAIRWSYNRLFNTPPLAQGALIGQAIQPELIHQYDIGVERQVGRGQLVKAAYYYKQINNQVDTGLLIPGSQIGLYSSLNLQYGGVHGVELSYELSPPKGEGLDGFLNYTFSAAKPNGLDSNGEQVPLFNDHDQTHTIGFGLAYLWKNGASAAVVANYGSGLASSPISLTGERVPRTQIDLRLTTGNQLFKGHGGIGLDVTNLMDDRTVINFQSAFSGTRFMQGRRILFSVFGTF